MITFYSKNGDILGRAWSTMVCDKARSKEVHNPHVHNPEFTMYGPYLCEGYPKVYIYDTAERKPLNP